MIAQITTAFDAVLGWIAQVVNAIVSSEGSLSALLPLLAIGVACTVVMFGIRVIRSFTWGA